MSEIVVVRSQSGTVDDAAFERSVQQLVGELRQAGGTNVISFYATDDEGLVSSDRDATQVLVGLGPQADEEAVKPLVAVVQALDDEPGVRRR